MRALIQKVEEASVIIENKNHASIERGLLILLGIEDSDNSNDIEWICGKISRLRIFNDNAGIMNLSIRDVNGSILVISQFTLHASTRKGNRPSYIRAAKPDIAIPLYENFINKLKEDSGLNVYSGKFGALMKVKSINDGPVTIWIDTKNKE